MRQRHAVLLALAGCGGVPVVTAAGGSLGTAAPYKLIATPPDGRWMVMCQARADTDGDGKLDVFWEMHGEAGGDTLLAYLIDDHGRETPLDNVLAVAPSGHYLAAVERGAPVLIETATWSRTPITGELPGFSITRGVRRWSFDPSSTHLLFFRGATPIVRDLATGTERAAPPAWRAEWSPDGSWLELDTLGGDTNHDGYVHGPDLSPSEGVPGHECGRKFEWNGSLEELDPQGTAIEPALASIENPDDLVHSLWRIGDGLAVPADTALDRDTVVAHAGGALRIGKPGAPLAIVGDARCQVGASDPVGHGVLLVCPAATGHTSLAWVRGAERKVLEADIADDRPLVEGDRTGFAGVFPFQLIVDLRTGVPVASGPDVYYEWSDADHVLIQRKDDHADVRWRDGRTVELAKSDDLHGHVAGRYLVRGKQRLDLATGAIVELPGDAITVREDGAVLLDGGPQKLDDGERGPRLGPLRWVTPR